MQNDLDVPGAVLGLHLVNTLPDFSQGPLRCMTTRFSRPRGRRYLLSSVPEWES